MQSEDKTPVPLAGSYRGGDCLKRDAEKSTPAHVMHQALAADMARDRRDTIAILTTKGPLATKIISSDGIKPYDDARRFSVTVRHVNCIFDTSTVLTELQAAMKSFIIRGAPKADANWQNMRRLLHPDAETGDTPTIVPTARRWVPLDIDKLDCPAHIDPIHHVFAVVEYVVGHLPPEFRGVTCHWAFTSSHGIKSGIRIRLWFWSNRPLADWELKIWLGDSPVDLSIYCPSQPIYTAAPIFRGMADPVPRRCGLWRGDRDEILPPTIARPAPPRLPEPQTINLTGTRAERYALAALRNAADRVASAGEGARNKTLNVQTWGLTRNFVQALGGQRIADTMVAAGMAAGLDRKEVVCTVASALRAGGVQ
jgi:hypothetical protein